MSDTELSKILNSSIDRPVVIMTDQQLAHWSEACGVMEHKAKPMKARRTWTKYRAEAEAEIDRRKVIDAEVQ